jgi:hypothetical protein
MNPATRHFATAWLGKMVIVALLLNMATFADDIWCSFDPKAFMSNLRDLILWPMLLSTLVLTVGVLFSLARFDWRQFITRAIALASSVLLMGDGGIAVHFVHFAVMDSHYRAEVAGRTGPIEIDWGITECFPGFVVPSERDEYILIYDTTGQTAMKAKSQGPYADQIITQLLGEFSLRVDRDYGC